MANHKKNRGERCTGNNHSHVLQHTRERPAMNCAVTAFFYTLPHVYLISIHGSCNRLHTLALQHTHTKSHHTVRTFACVCLGNMTYATLYDWIAVVLVRRHAAVRHMAGCCFHSAVHCACIHSTHVHCICVLPIKSTPTNAPTVYIIIKRYTKVMVTS